MSRKFSKNWWHWFRLMTDPHEQFCWTSRQCRVMLLRRETSLSSGGDYVSLSRLNHRLPRGQTHPEVVEGAAEFHHEITDASLPQADEVFDNAAALDTTVHMLDPPPPLVEYLVGQLLLQGQLLTAWLLRRHEHRHLRERERQKAQSLQHPTPGQEWGGSGLGDAQLMDTAAVGVAQTENDEQALTNRTFVSL